MGFEKSFNIDNGQEKSNGEAERLNIRKLLENRKLRRRLAEDTKEWLNANI